MDAGYLWVALGAWVVLSVPASLALGALMAFGRATEPELVDADRCAQRAA
jgi:hypothetical protein